MPKSSQAFRTISEVADDLEIQKHVLRFWESKFTQLKPMKRGGGRRYYRPEDVELLRGIHHLLRSQAYTIKGVQRILREQGVDHVKACWQGGTEAAAAAELAPAATGRPGRKPKAAKTTADAASRDAVGRAGPAPESAESAQAIKGVIDQLESARSSLAKTRTATVATAAAPSVPAPRRGKTTTKRS